MKDAPQNVTISLANFMVFKTSAVGSMSLMVVDNLQSVCKEGAAEHVLCEGETGKLLAKELITEHFACSRSCRSFGFTGITLSYKAVVVVNFVTSPDKTYQLFSAA